MTHFNDRRDKPVAGLQKNQERRSSLIAFSNLERPFEGDSGPTRTLNLFGDKKRNR